MIASNIPCVFLTFCLFFSGCGYHWAVPLRESCSVSVPYVCGDEDGAFTATLIRELVQQGISVRSEGRFRLEVAITHTEDETISYRVDPQKIRGAIKKEIVGDQNRRTAVVELTLLDGGVPLMETQRIHASIDYDYYDGDSYTDLSFDQGKNRVSVLAYSLGQLDSSEAAQESAARPLYTCLSRKIIAGIIMKLRTQDEQQNLH